MKPGYLRFSMFSLIIIIIVMIMMSAAGLLPFINIIQPHSTAEVRDTLVRPVEPNSDPSAGAAAMATPAVSQAEPLKDGQTLLESHCTRCHLAQVLAKVEKSRLDWELTLEQMEAVGVQLEDAEKVVLLDYLSTLAKP